MTQWICIMAPGEQECSRPIPCQPGTCALQERQRERDMLESSNWRPISTAPKDNKRPLYFARFDENGKLVQLDFDGAWEYWQESWELSHINGYTWMSANGIEEPTHWAYQDEELPAESVLKSENRELRRLLATNYSGGALYTDDGELQDNRTHPFIDFKRDPVTMVIEKMKERTLAAQAERARQDAFDSLPDDFEAPH